MNWADINDRIRRCRAGGDPVGCLTRLFEASHDGHVAFALGQEYREHGDKLSAAKWFKEARSRYPLEKYRALADKALTALRIDADQTKPARADDPISDTVLHIVSCTAHKIWRDDPDAPSYVAAKEAYRGRTMRDWLASKESHAGVRWLVLSAKYGFIEPDHPIADYNVTFDDPDTGPISSASLRAQVLGQARWPDKMPLRRFRTVLVHGSATYLHAAEEAFMGVAEVVRATSSAAPSVNGLIERPDRIRAVAAALARLPSPVFESADQAEPEWKVLELLARWPDDQAFLAALAIGLIDYQLAGDADAFWATVETCLDSRPGTQSPQVLLDCILASKASVRLNSQKRARVERLLRSDVPQWLDGRRTAEVGVDGDILWSLLADAVGADEETKTVAFAMKLVDLLHRIRTGRYIAFQRTVPIIVDLRVARLTLTSGMLDRRGRPPASKRDWTKEEVGQIRRAWADVARLTGISLFRIDSVVWQLAAELVPENRESLRRFVAKLTSYGASPDIAVSVASELLGVASVDSTSGSLSTE